MKRAAVGAWEPCERYRVSGVDLAVVRRGSGPAVVCLHAIAHGARDFKPLAERIGDACEIIAVDWPGHGRSGEAVADASAASYADVLEALLPQLSGGPVVVLGCSIGGAAAILVGARRPDLVRGLVLCNTGGLLPVDGFTRAATGGMRAFFAAGARRSGWYARAFGWYYRMVLSSRAAASQRERIVAAGYETAAILAQAWASFGRPEADLRALVPRLSQPVLVAWARHDRILPWWRHKSSVAQFPHHRVELFDGGHAAFLEDPDRFAHSLREFVGDLDNCGRS